MVGVVAAAAGQGMGLKAKEVGELADDATGRLIVDAISSGVQGAVSSALTGQAFNFVSYLENIAGNAIGQKVGIEIK